MYAMDSKCCIFSEGTVEHVMANVMHLLQPTMHIIAEFQACNGKCNASTTAYNAHYCRVSGIFQQRPTLQIICTDTVHVGPK